MTDVGLASLVHAIVTLQTSTNLEERTAADKWLRKWQISPEAWQGILQLLNEPSLAYEIHLMAAILLRTKLLYDFVQVPATDHEALCTSLLGYIERFKHYQQKSILKTLALAFADLSIHTCRSWTNFLDVLYETLCLRPGNQIAWLCCLAALPQENMKENLLADPVDVNAHTEILKSKFTWVSMQIVSILHSPTTDVALAVEAVEGFLQWATFAHRFLDFSKVTFFPPTVIDLCFKLIETKPSDARLCDRIQESLSQIVWLASKNPNAHEDLLTKTLNELATSTGRLRLALLEALEEDDGATTLRLAIIYSDACCGSCHKITLLFWQGETLVKELLGIFLRLTSVGFDLYDDARGSNGIAAMTLRFWDRFITKINSQKRQLEEVISEKYGRNQTQGPSAPRTSSNRSSAFRDILLADMASHGALNENSWRACISELDTLFNFLFHALVRLCWVPVAALGKTEAPSLYEFYRFRHSVSNTFLNLCCTYTPEAIFTKLSDSLTSGFNESNVTVLQRHQEAHFYLMSQLLREDEFVHPLRAESDINTESDQELGDLGESIISQHGANRNELLGILEKFFQAILAVLSPAPPESILECFCRISAAEVLYGACYHRIIHPETEGINTILDRLAQQVFCADLVDAKTYTAGVALSTDRGYASEKTSDNNVITLESSRLLLAETTSDALRQLCCSSGSTTFLTFLLNRLYLALLGFPQLHDKAYCNILEGLAVITSTLPQDNDFFQWCSKLLSPYISAIRSQKNVTEICTQLDRLSLFLQGVSPRKKERREFLGEFVATQLWPVVEGLWKMQPESGALVESCGRVIKHAVRCVKPETFRCLLPVFVSSVITNAKMHLHSTFMYIAEWLITEYSGDADARPTLQLLFEELARIGTITLKTQLENEGNLDKNVVEDFFGLFSRSLRFQPAIPGNSQALPETFSLVIPCLHHPNVVAVSMTCTFLENCVWIVSNNEREEGLLLANNAGLHSAVQNIKILIKKHLEAIVIEIFRVLSKIPSKTIVHIFCGVLLEFRMTYKEELKQALVGTALHCLPASVISSENYKMTVINHIVTGDLRQQLIELHERCRRASLRQCEADLLHNC